MFSFSGIHYHICTKLPSVSRILCRQLGHCRTKKMMQQVNSIENTHLLSIFVVKVEFAMSLPAYHMTSDFCVDLMPYDSLI